MSDFELARWLAFTIYKGRRPGASEQEAEQAQAMCSLLGYDPSVSAQLNRYPSAPYDVSLGFAVPPQHDTQHEG